MMMRVYVVGKALLAICILGFGCKPKSKTITSEAPPSCTELAQKVEAVFQRTPSASIEDVEAKPPAIAIRFYGMRLGLPQIPTGVRLKGVCVRVQMRGYEIQLLEYQDHTWGQDLDALLAALTLEAHSGDELAEMSAEEVNRYFRNLVLKGLLPWKDIFVTRLDSHCGVWGNVKTGMWYGVIFDQAGVGALDCYITFEGPVSREYGDSIFRDFVRELRLDSYQERPGMTLVESAKAAFTQRGIPVADERGISGAPSTTGRDNDTPAPSTGD